jgi:hypothetical protein
MKKTKSNPGKLQDLLKTNARANGQEQAQSPAMSMPDIMQMPDIKQIPKIKPKSQQKRKKLVEKKDMQITPQLGVIQIRWCDFYLLIKSIKEYSESKIKQIANFNPYFAFFEKECKESDYYRFNTKKTLDCQVSETEGLVSGKIKPLHIKTVSFIGEDFDKLHLFEKQNHCFNVNNRHLALLQYDLNSGANIEIFMSYLVATLVENKLCPSFNYFYFSAHIIKKQFYYDIPNSSLSSDTMRVIYTMINYGRASYEVSYSEESDDDDCPADISTLISSKTETSLKTSKTSTQSNTSNITQIIEAVSYTHLRAHET